MKNSSSVSSFNTYTKDLCLSHLEYVISKLPKICPRYPDLMKEHRYLWEKLGISNQVISDLDIHYLANRVEVDLAESDSEFYKGSDLMKFGPGLLFPIYTGYHLRGAIVVNDKWNAYLVRGSSNITLDIGFRPNKPVVLVSNPLLAAALFSRFGDKISVSTLCIGRKPNSYELFKYADNPCILIDDDDGKLGHHIPDWKKSFRSVQSFVPTTMNDEIDLDQTASKLVDRLEDNLSKLRIKAIPTALTLPNELRQRIRRFGGAMKLFTVNHVPDYMLHESTSTCEEVENWNVMGRAGKEMGRPPFAEWLAMCERDGVCSVFNMQKVKNMGAYIDYTISGCPVSEGSYLSQQTQGIDISLKGMASFLAGTPISYEDSVLEHLEGILDERDLELLFDCEESLPELAAFRAVVNNLLLNRLVDALRGAKRYDSFAEHFVEEADEEEYEVLIRPYTPSYTIRPATQRRQRKLFPN